MKTEKMSFKNIKDALSRDEMKEIMAGSSGRCGSCQDRQGVWTCEAWGSGNCSCPSAINPGNRCT